MFCAIFIFQTRSSKDVIRLFNEIIHRKSIYVNNEVKIRFDHLIRDIPEALRIDSNDKSIFKLLTTLLLNIPDEIICNSHKEISPVVLILETILLQYFRIGTEMSQKINITYNELYEMLYLSKK